MVCRRKREIGGTPHGLGIACASRGSLCTSRSERACRKHVGRKKSRLVLGSALSRELLHDTPCSSGNRQDREGARPFKQRKLSGVAAQILGGVSLVTFFAPAKKVTRWPQDSGSSCSSKDYRENWITRGSCRVPCGPIAARMFASASCLRSPAFAGMTTIGRFQHAWE